MAVDTNNNNNNAIPPYIRKYNRRFKSIYETMHKNPFEEDERMRQYERNFRLQKKNNNKSNDVYGYFEKYKTDQYRTNEIPENDVLSEIMQKSAHKKHKHHDKHDNHHHQHHHHQINSHHHKIKRLRTKPQAEAALMQKKLKI